MKVLELFSGIGGMHLALKESGVRSEVLASVDINPIANDIYKHNFPETTLLTRNIESINAEFINQLNVDTILMSPPCQPFTRNGLKKDTKDTRTNPFTKLLNILADTEISRILIENVKGFETSQMRGLLIETLTAIGFDFQEFILSPNQFKIPNTRHRYYCLANRNHKLPSIKFVDNNKENCWEISQILDDKTDLNKYCLNDEVLKKYYKVLDICYSNSKRSCCFTKAYGRYIEGTGSVFTNISPEIVQDVMTKAANYDRNDPELISLLRSLNLRFFTPREVCRLMSFPETFSFPGHVTDKQKYRVLGNSVNVKVVSELIKILE